MRQTKQEEDKVLANDGKGRRVFFTILYLNTYFLIIVTMSTGSCNSYTERLYFTIHEFYKTVSFFKFITTKNRVMKTTRYRILKHAETIRVNFP